MAGQGDEWRDSLFRGDSYGQVLANRDFRALWLGQALALLGQAVVYVAVALYVYDLTGSARELSFALALELLPYVLIGPLAGLLADRLERRSILLAAYLVQAILVAALPFTTTLAQVYVLVFLSSLLAPVAGLVRAAALPAVTGQELFVRGNSLDIVALNGVNVIGPLLAGWLAGLWGARPTLFIAAGCLLGAALWTLPAKIPGPARDRREPLRLGLFWTDLREGLRFLLRQPVLRFSLLLNCVVSLGWSAPNVAAIVYLNDTLGTGGREYGLLRGIVSLGIALGVFVLGRYGRRWPRQHLLVGGAVLAGLAYTLVLGRPGLVTLLGLWFVAGVGWAGFWLTDDTLWAQATSDEVRGRAYSLAEAAISLAEVSTALLGGWLVSLWGPCWTLLFIGVVVSAGALLLSLLGGGYKMVAQFNEQAG